MLVCATPCPAAVEQCFKFQALRLEEHVQSPPETQCTVNHEVFNAVFVSIISFILAAKSSIHFRTCTAVRLEQRVQLLPETRSTVDHDVCNAVFVSIIPPSVVVPMF